MTVARVEITSIGHDERGRRLFEVAQHHTDGARSSIWEGLSYDAAISAAEVWADDGVEVVDTVVEAVDVEIDNPPRVPAAWVVAEQFGLVRGVHIELWRRIGEDRVIVAISPTPTPGGFVSAAIGNAATTDMLRILAPSMVVALQAADANWRSN